MQIHTHSLTRSFTHTHAAVATITICASTSTVFVLSVCLSVCLPVCLLVCLSLSTPLYQSLGFPRLAVCSSLPPFFLSVSVHPSICLAVWLYNLYVCPSINIVSISIYLVSICLLFVCLTVCLHSVFEIFDVEVSRSVIRSVHVIRNVIESCCFKWQPLQHRGPATWSVSTVS